MNRLVINKEGKIEYNSIEIKKQDLTSTFFRDIFMQLLKRDLVLDCDADSEISYVFKRMQEETKEESEFYQTWMQKKQEYTSSLETVENLQKEV